METTPGRRFAVVVLFETLGVGTALSRSAWPAHVTLASNFVADVSAEDVARAVSRTDTLNDPIVVQFGKRAHFGPNQTVPVQLVHSVQAFSLHHGLGDQLELLPGFAADEPEYWRDGYRPHVTLTPTIEVKEGDRWTASCIAVVTLRGDLLHVESIFTSAHGSGSTGRGG